MENTTLSIYNNGFIEKPISYSLITVCIAWLGGDSGNGGGVWRLGGGGIKVGLSAAILPEHVHVEISDVNFFSQVSGSTVPLNI